MLKNKSELKVSIADKSSQFAPYMKQNMKELEKLKAAKNKSKDSLQVKFLNIAPFQNNGTVKKKRTLSKKRFNSLSSSFCCLQK